MRKDTTELRSVIATMLARWGRSATSAPLLADAMLILLGNPAYLRDLLAATGAEVIEATTGHVYVSNPGPNRPGLILDAPAFVVRPRGEAS